MVDDLASINGHGFLTINSQPNVNASPSNDEKVGWGGSGGYIYQKAYLEFFMHKHTVPVLLDVLKVNYHVIDSKVSRKFCDPWKEEFYISLLIRPLHATDLFLYPLKASENLKHQKIFGFLMFSGEIERC